MSGVTWQPDEFYGLIRMPKFVPVPLGPPVATDNRNFQAVRRELLDKNHAFVAGIWLEVLAREPKQLGVRNDKYGLFAFGPGGRPTRILQLEVYPGDRLSHRGSSLIRGPHVHYYDAGGTERVRALRRGDPDWGRDRWFRLFLCLTNTRPVWAEGQLNLLGGMLPWP